MVSTRCCPADCAIREDWEEELNQVKSAHRMKPHKNGADTQGYQSPIRLKILLMLSNRDQCVCEFIWIFKESSTLISNHLKILKDAGLIETYYRSNHKIYRFREDADRTIITFLHQQWKKNTKQK
ncbi:ArsR/SmtB family transcription factor [Methanospirillum lacunae]|uniref:HTH arsR-type domain-containing protein n=1 Tax=Methanospirillum lacunae TaxID=668570 RepID=A0A2V2MRU2_9EURY|nr:winged helix-turn-helix domain-containing protein [Methanospirillum lacunae]PWR70954.1 hypothetical protein DK846_13290 [Methanospirillum lacunae]